MIHYVLTESQNDPATDPLVIWFNGGPGCSSMLGWSQENGPWALEDGATTFHKNEYSWNTNATILYIEQPAGVGFSYCNSSIEGECNFDDWNSATDNVKTLLKWYEKFPDYLNHDLYISGESYAGIYIPRFMDAIDQHNGNQTTPMINLKGILVGNGCTNWTYDAEASMVEITYWHGLMARELWTDMLAAKCDWSGLPWGEVTSETCENYIDEWDNSMNLINLYNLYGTCWGAEPQSEHNQFSMYKSSKESLVSIGGTLRSYQREFSKSMYTPWTKHHQNKLAKKKMVGDDENEVDCTYNKALLDYMNSAEVRTALHIPEGYASWAPCKDDFVYDISHDGTQEIWERLNGKYRMLKYSGDVDAVVGTLGTLGWIKISKMSKTEIKPWRQWTIPNSTEVAGYTWNLEGLDFASVHGAGHMVPQDKRAAAHHMFNTWLAGNTL